MKTASTQIQDDQQTISRMNTQGKHTNTSQSNHKKKKQ